jgi:hypothetical protein
MGGALFMVRSSAQSVRRGRFGHSTLDSSPGDRDGALATQVTAMIRQRADISRLKVTPSPAPWNGSGRARGTQRSYYFWAAE